MMRELELVDSGIAPEIHIDGIGRIVRRDGTIKYVCYSARETLPGHTELVVVAYVTMTAKVAESINAQLRTYFEVGVTMTPDDPPRPMLLS